MYTINRLFDTDSEYYNSSQPTDIHPNNKSGDMQGLEVNAEYLYAYTDAKGYRININKINK